MRDIRIRVEDENFDRLKEIKGDRSWRDALLEEFTATNVLTLKLGITESDGIDDSAPLGIVGYTFKPTGESWLHGSAIVLRTVDLYMKRDDEPWTTDK